MKTYSILTISILLISILLFSCSNLNLEKSEWKDITPTKNMMSAMFKVGGDWNGISFKTQNANEMTFVLGTNNELLITAYKHNFRTEEKSNFTELKGKFQIIEKNKLKISEIQLNEELKIPEQIVVIKKAQDVKYSVYLFDLKVIENGEAEVHSFMNMKYKYKPKDLMKFE